MNLSERITMRLAKENKTQADLARFLNTKQSTVLGWVKLDRSPSADTIVRICEFLHCSPTWLLTGEGEEEARILLDISGLTPEHVEEAKNYVDYLRSKQT